MPIDTLEWDFVVVPGTDGTDLNPPKEGAYCSGLSLEGAQWDMKNNHLEEPMPMQLYAPRRGS